LQDIATDPDAQASCVKRSTKSVLQWLSRVEHDWLIVYDNVDADVDVTEYLPQGDRGNILFTSRNLDLGYVPCGARIEVGGMDEGDAISLLLKSSSIAESSMQLREAAGLIVKELCYLPLAIDQAGAAIASGLCDIGDYLSRCSKHRQQFLADSTFQGVSNYGHTVYWTLDLSFAAINKLGTEGSESAIFILRTFPFLHENIMEDTIRQAAKVLDPSNLGDGGDTICLPPRFLQLDQEGNWDPSYFREGIRILLSYSIIEEAAISGSYLIHPLVRSWSRGSEIITRGASLSYFLAGKRVYVPTVIIQQ